MPDRTESVDVSTPWPQLDSDRLIAVLRGSRASSLSAAVEVLLAAGIRLVELTLTTPKALEELTLVRERYGSDVQVGMGSIVHAAQAREAIDAGAQFVVSPSHVEGLIDRARASSVPIISGGFSPTELISADAEGASAVKLFPASLAGERYVRELLGPAPHLRIVPSGGVSIEAIPAWLGAGCVAVSLGGALVGDALEAGGDREALRRRAVHARRLVDESRGSDD